jgi:hypothetical protein
MKTFFFTATLALIFGSASAQKMKAADVPSPVKAKLTSLYPTIKNAKWEKEGANYEAEFDMNGEMSVSFDASGNLVETETEAKLTDIPQTAKEYMTKNVPGAKIKETSKIVDAAGKTTWEIEANKKDYIFEESGNFIKAVDGD